MNILSYLLAQMSFFFMKVSQEANAFEESLCNSCYVTSGQRDQDNKDKKPQKANKIRLGANLKLSLDKY